MRKEIEIVEEWRATRNICADRDIHRVDEGYAKEIGLPTLSALLAALQEIRSAHPRVSREEVIDLLRSVLEVAVGEGNERLLVHTGIREGVPGISTIPRRLLERDAGAPIPRERVIEIYRLFDFLATSLALAGTCHVQGKWAVVAGAITEAGRVADEIEEKFAAILTAEERSDEGGEEDDHS